jgi:small-conductance mechanosensitive channel
MAFLQFDFLNNLPGGPAAVFILLLIVLTIILHVAFVILVKLFSIAVKKTKTSLDDRILKKISGYLPLVALLTALALSLNSVYPEFTLGNLTEWDVYLILLLGVMAVALSSILDIVLIWYGQEIRPSRRKLSEKEIFPFVRNVIKVLIYLVFLVFVLQKAGVETTALITGLGIGGLAVALALQDTLSNFFSGIHLLIDKPFREGDYVKMENDMEGWVRRIGWRTTKIRTWAENEIFVPNSKLANAILQNYSTREKSGLYYTIGVDYKEDVDVVEKTIQSVLTKVSKKNENMLEDSGWTRFAGFGDFSLNFKFGYQVKGYTNRFKVLKDVQRELFYTFKKKKIEIPYPVSVVYRKEMKKK